MNEDKKQEKKEKKEQLFTPGTKDESKFTEEEKAVTNVISRFKDLITDDASLNRVLKPVFFLVCCIILFLITVTLIVSLDTVLRYQLQDNSPELAIEIVTMVGGFIAAFMKVIQTIANNLFNVKLQETITDIITKKEKNKEDK